MGWSPAIRESGFLTVINPLFVKKKGLSGDFVYDDDASIKINPLGMLDMCRT